MGSPTDIFPVYCRYHAAAATHAIPRQTILRHRASALEMDILLQNPKFAQFTIWGAGRDGRQFFKALTNAGRERVVAFCDVDPTKIGTKYQYFEHQVPVIDWRAAVPPIITCVALGRTGGAFEANLASLGLTEGVDFYYFC